MLSLKRTATFLSPYDYRYMMMKEREPRIQNTAVDVRTYQVSYTKL